MSADNRSTARKSDETHPPASEKGDRREAGEEKGTSARSGGAAAVIVLILLLILPVAYVLSIGPVVWLNTRDYIHVGPDSPVEKFYAPLEYAHENLPTVAAPLDWYVELWAAPPQPVALPTPPVTVPQPMAAPAPATTPQPAAAPTTPPPTTAVPPSP